MKYHTDLVVGEAFCIFIFFHFPNSGLSVLNGLHFIFMASQWKQRMDYFDDQHTITVPMINVVLNFCHIYLSHAQKSLKTQ